MLNAGLFTAADLRRREDNLEISEMSPLRLYEAVAGYGQRPFCGGNIKITGFRKLPSRVIDPSHERMLEPTA